MDLQLLLSVSRLHVAQQHLLCIVLLGKSTRGACIIIWGLWAGLERAQDQAFSPDMRRFYSNLCWIQTYIFRWEYWIFFAVIWNLFKHILKCVFITGIPTFGLKCIHLLLCVSGSSQDQTIGWKRPAPLKELTFLWFHLSKRRLVWVKSTLTSPQRGGQLFSCFPVLLP